MTDNASEVKDYEKKNDEKNWQTLVYELFEICFQQVVPGSLAVLLYIQPWTDKVLTSPNAMSAVVFFVFAWVAGAGLGIVSYDLPLYLSCPKSGIGNTFLVIFTLAVGGSIFYSANPQDLPTETILVPLKDTLLFAGGLAFFIFVFHINRNKSGSLEEKLGLVPFDELVKLAQQSKRANLTIQGRTNFATTIMFRSLAALSLISFASPPKFHWPDGVYGALASIASFAAFSLCWFLVRRGKPPSNANAAPFPKPNRSQSDNKT